MAYVVPDYGARNPGTFPTGRNPARQQPTRNYPARPIANIFVHTGNIDSGCRGQEREGGGERLQGPEGGGEKGRLKERDAVGREGGQTQHWMQTRMRKRKSTPR